MKKTLKNLLFILSLTSFLLIANLLEITDGNEISYSQVMEEIEENSNQIEKIVVKPKNSEVIITFKKNEKDIRYTAIVPNTENFIQMAMNLKADNEGKFDISISRPVWTYVGYIFKAFIIYLLIRLFWKKIFDIIFQYSSKKNNINSKNKQNEKHEGNPKIGIDFEKGQGSTSFKELKQILLNDFTKELYLFFPIPSCTKVSQYKPLTIDINMEI